MMGKNDMHKAPVRILHIIYKMGRGGLESRTMDIYRKLNKDKFQFDFYIRSGERGDFDDEIRALGGKIFYGKSHKIFNVPDFKDFQNFLKVNNYKIIFAYDHWSGWFLRIADNLGVPVRIASARNAMTKFNLGNIARNLIKSPVNIYANYKFAVSKLAAEWLFGRKAVERSEVEIERNSIDATKFMFNNNIREEMRRGLNLNNNNLAVIHVGNFREQKNHAFLIKVFSEILKLNNNARLILIGGGDAEQIKLSAEELNILDKINFLGSRSDINKLLQAGDVFIFPSFYEGFPGAVLEAEASGLPCLISDFITDEVVLTQNILRIALSKGENFWAEQALILSKNIFNRAEACNIIKAAGYDINTLIKHKEEFFDKVISEILI